MRFTIVIPCFNRHDALRAAIASCLAQTFADFEVLVVDDCSSPSLEEVCNEFRDGRVRYLHNTVNLGVSRSRNVGLDHASGEYVSFLDSDDLYLPQRLEVLDQHIRMAKTPPSVLFHRQRRILEPGQAGMQTPPRMPRKRERLDEYVLVEGNFIQTNSFIVERGLAQSIRFDSQCRIYEDTRFIIECWLASSNYVACNDVLSVYHDFQSSSRLSKQRGFERLRPMLVFTGRRCSRRAHIGFDAFTAADISFLRHPIRVLAKIWRAYRQGVPKLRCGVYLARSVFGSAAVDGSIFRLRSALRRFRHPSIEVPVVVG